MPKTRTSLTVPPFSTEDRDVKDLGRFASERAAFPAPVAVPIGLVWILSAFSAPSAVNLTAENAEDAEAEGEP
jgi:hypothetical protein